MPAIFIHDKFIKSMTSLQPLSDHDDECECRLCAKERQISEIRKLRANLHLQTSYKYSFNTKQIKKKKKEQSDKNRSESCLAPISYAYVDLESTYHKDYEKKKGEVIKFRPKDNLSSPKNNTNISTTYLQSYHSTLTPKPDEPMKSPEMPIGNGLLPFSAQSIYQKSFKQQQKMSPSLPIIQKQCLSLPKSIGSFQSTQRDSYLACNPEKSNPMIKPVPNLVNQRAFGHNFDTTYRNFFINMESKAHRKHDVDEIGNINWKYNRKGMRQKKFNQ